MVKPKAITVLSGGLDSTVATAYFKDKYDIQGVTFDYGQRSARMEIKSAGLSAKIRYRPYSNRAPLAR